MNNIVFMKGILDACSIGLVMSTGSCDCVADMAKACTTFAAVCDELPNRRTTKMKISKKHFLNFLPASVDRYNELWNFRHQCFFHGVTVPENDFISFKLRSV